MSLTDKQLEVRRKGIGGSDVAAICGLSPWRTAFQVWQSKLDLEVKAEATPEMKYGLLIEPTIRQWYSNETGRIVRVPKEMLWHPKHMFMVANLDGVTDDNRVIEIKTSRSSSDWGEPGTDEIPVYYQTQVQHYLIVTGFEVCDVPVSFAGSMPVIYEVPADKELQEMIIEKETEFWDLVLKKEPPEPVTLSDMIARFRKANAVEVVATPDTLQWVQTIRQVREQAKSLEQAEEEAKAEIMKFLGDSDTLIDSDGKKLVTWKESKATKRFDAKLFQIECPDVYQQYVRVGEPTRRFLIK